MQRTAEKQWGIVQEGIKSGNISETCRRYGIAPTLFYRWKDGAEQGAKAALGGRSAGAAGASFAADGARPVAPARPEGGSKSLWPATS